MIVIAAASCSRQYVDIFSKFWQKLGKILALPNCKWHVMQLRQKHNKVMKRKENRWGGRGGVFICDPAADWLAGPETRVTVNKHQSHLDKILDIFMHMHNFTHKVVHKRIPTTTEGNQCTKYWLKAEVKSSHRKWLTKRSLLLPEFVFLWKHLIFGKLRDKRCRNYSMSMCCLKGFITEEE